VHLGGFIIKNPPNEGLKLRCWQNTSSGLCAVTSKHTDGKVENVAFKTQQNTLLPHMAVHVTPLQCSTLCIGPWACGDVLRWPNLSDVLTRPDTSTIHWACNRICFLNVADKHFCIPNNRRAEISSARWMKLISWRTFYRLWAAMWRHWSHGLSAH
jgi:hypothetical protein